MDIIYTTFLFLLRDGWKSKMKTPEIPTNFLNNNDDDADHLRECAWSRVSDIEKEEEKEIVK